MRTLLLLLLAAFSLQSSAVATSLGLIKVWMPVYLHGADMDSRIDIVEVPMMSASDSTMTPYSAICLPFTPPSASSWVKPRNINIAAEYGLSVGLDDTKEVKGVYHWVITVDATKASVPEGYPFTLEQVIDSVVTCAKLTRPQVPASERVITIEIKRPVK